MSPMSLNVACLFHQDTKNCDPEDEWSTLKKVEFKYLISHLWPYCLISYFIANKPKSFIPYIFNIYNLSVEILFGHNRVTLPINLSLCGTFHLSLKKDVLFFFRMLPAFFQGSFEPCLALLNYCVQAWCPPQNKHVDLLQLSLFSLDSLQQLLHLSSSSLSPLPSQRPWGLEMWPTKFLSSQEVFSYLFLPYLIEKTWSLPVVLYA